MKGAVMPKLKVLVAGAKQQLVNDFQAAIKAAGLARGPSGSGIRRPGECF